MKTILAILALLCFIVVSSAAPTVPTISGPTSGASGTALSFSSAATEQLKYTFAWGDGTSTTSILLDSGTPASASHAYTVAPGGTQTFQVSVTATDGAQAATSVSYPVVITGPTTTPNRPPAKPSIPRGTFVGNTKYSYTYQTKATDPDGDQVKLIFNWGDGTTTTTEYVASGAWASATHQWVGIPGMGVGFDITARAVDAHGLESVACSTLHVSMGTDLVNHPPTIPSIPSGPTSGISGTSYTFSTSATDPDGDYIKYIFEWGDGSSETGYFPSGQAVSASHSWNNVPAGTTRSYNVRAMCADSNYMKCPSPYWSNPFVIAITG